MKPVSPSKDITSLRRLAALLLTLGVIYGMSGAATATCQTQYDYCINITLPNWNQSNLGLPPGQTSVPTSYIIDLDSILNTNNIEDQPYLIWNYSNIFSWVDNTTDTTNGGLWNGPYLESNDITDPAQEVRLRVDRATGDANGFENTSYLNICLNGTTDTFDYTVVSPLRGGAQALVEHTLPEFTQYYRRNWTFRDEPGGGLHSFTGELAPMTVWCDTLGEFELNLTDLVAGGGSLTVQTAERPKYVLPIDNQPERVREDTDNFLRGDFYVLDSTSGLEYTFSLYDYTAGDFYRGTMSIFRTINDQQQPMHVERFDQSNSLDAYLLNRTQYRITLTADDGAVRDLGNLYLTEDTTKDVVVTQPQLGSFAFRYQDSVIDITQDWENSVVGCNVNGSERVTAFMVVENVSLSGSLTEEYYTDAETLSAGFVYTVSRQNGTYWVKCGWNDTVQGPIFRRELINLRNESAIFMGFDLNIPASVVGLSRSFIYDMISLIAIAVVIGIFSSISFGVGAIATGLTIVAAKWIGWLDTSWEIAFIAFYIGVFLLLRKDREALQ